MGNTITVFRAGTSGRCGFPLADDFFPRVKTFGESLDDRFRQLQRVIEHVVERAQALDCSTPDDLALQMYQTAQGENYYAAGNTLYYARIVTDARLLVGHLQEHRDPGPLIDQGAADGHLPGHPRRGPLWAAKNRSETGRTDPVASLDRRKSNNIGNGDLRGWAGGGRRSQAIP